MRCTDCDVNMASQRKFGRVFRVLIILAVFCMVVAYSKFREDSRFLEQYDSIVARIIRRGLLESDIKKDGCENISGVGCTDVTFDKHNITREKCTILTGWQTISINSSYVYSAYLMPVSDDISSQIQIIVNIRDDLFKGYIANMTDVNYFVWIYFEDKTLISKCDVTRDAGNNHIHEGVFNPGLLICVLPVGRFTLMNAMVSVVEGAEPSNPQPANCLPLLHQYLTEENKYNFTVCLGGPLRYANPRWFVEWIELNRLFGAEKVVIHDMGQTGELEPYLQYYSQLGILDWLEWSFIPGMNLESPLPFWQQSAMTDCLLRLQRHSRFVVQHDLDELLVPRGADQFTWQEMISGSGCGWERPSYSGRHLFYERKGENINHTGLFSQNILNRAELVIPYPKRNKYIANTWLVSFLATHDARRGGKEDWKKEKRDKDTCVLDVEQGGVHHYRICKKSPCIQTGPTVEDAALSKYNATIAQRVERVFNTVVIAH